MKSGILLLFLAAVIIVPAISSKRHLRRNRENDERSWGLVDDKSELRLPNDGDFTTTTSGTYPPYPYYTTIKTDDDIRDSIEWCNPYNTTSPDYSQRGRRISQVKCLEFTWSIRTRFEIVYRANECYVHFMDKKGFKVIGDQVGGRIARDAEFPHMGAVGWKAVNGSWIFKCGATLISDKFALTAAHCTRDSGRDEAVSDPVPKIVRLGRNSIAVSQIDRGGSVDAEISRIIRHPAYKSPKVYHDIALFEFKNPIEFTNTIHPACLWGSHNETKLGNQAMSSGWGVTDAVKRTTSSDLQVTVLDYINYDQCKKLLSSNCNRKFCGLQKTQLCAGKLNGGVDACQGDSGGPLQNRIKLPNEYEETLYYVIGVTSFGFGCAKANTPGVYTRVSSYLDWIEQNVWGSHGVQRE